MLTSIIICLVLVAMFCLVTAIGFDTTLYVDCHIYHYFTPEKPIRYATLRLVSLEMAIIFGAIAAILIVLKPPPESRNPQSADLEIDAVYQLISQSEVDGKYYAVLKRRQENSEPELYGLERPLPEGVYFKAVKDKDRGRLVLAPLLK